ncbi:MAG TPA: MFS transporter [Candidatus Acidoferrales bacterium]|nr:MFS transporter [Candidatus Acidoferrales bacterium]
MHDDALDDVAKPPVLDSEQSGRFRTKRFKVETFSSLRHRNYRFLWAGTVLMGAGQWLQQVTLGWLLYDLTGSSVLLGALNGVRAIPFLIAGPIAGVIADRVDRRRLLLKAEQLLFVTAVVMGSLVVSDLVSAWHLFLFTLVTGTAWSFTDPVRQSLVPNVVPKQDLVNAVALNSIAFNITKVLGPALGGLLIALVGAGGNFFIQGVAYAGVLAMVYAMHVPPTPDQARRSSMLANLKEGVGYVWSNSLILSLISLALVPRIFAVPYQTLMPIFQKDVLGVGPAGLGLLMAAPGVGALVALLTLATLASRLRRQGVFLLGSVMLLGLLLIVFSQTTSFRLALVVLVGVGACQVFFNATVNTMLQMIVPDALRGRAMSIFMLDRGLMPAGALLAGISAHFIGAPATTTWMGTVVFLLALFIAWRVPLIRGVEI